MIIRFWPFFWAHETRAIAIWPFIFIRKGYDTPERINHERIHLRQWEELWILGFPPVYFWLLFKHGYRNSPMEREAFDNENDLTYLERRPRFAWAA